MVGCANVCPSAHVSICACVGLGRFRRCPAGLLASLIASIALQLDHVDLASEHLLLLLLGRPVARACCLLLDNRRRLGWLLSCARSKREVLLRLALGRGGVLRSAVALATRWLIRWLKVRLRGLRLSWHSVTFTVLLERLPCLSVVRCHIIVLCLFDQLDDLLGVLELRRVASRFSHGQVLLFLSVDGVSLVYGRPARAIVTFKVVDELDFVRAKHFIRLPGWLLGFGRRWFLTRRLSSFSLLLLARTLSRLLPLVYSLVWGVLGHLFCCLVGMPLTRVDGVL